MSAKKPVAKVKEKNLERHPPRCREAQACRRDQGASAGHGRPLTQGPSRGRPSAEGNARRGRAPLNRTPGEGESPAADRSDHLRTGLHARGDRIHDALDDYKRRSGRMFPTCSEILEVFKALGYEKRAELPAVAPLAVPVAVPAVSTEQAV